MRAATYTTATGLVLPRLGQGTWQMGGARSSHAAEVRSLRCGLDLGLALIDTAEMYADGGAERVVGEAIAGRRDGVFLVTKVLPQNASRAGTRTACERSLRRLGTDRIDLYLLHWPGPHPLEDTLAALRALQDEGKVRGYGLSNFDWEHMGSPGIAANQVYYNLRRRGPERRLLPACEERGIAFMAYTPLEQGRLAKDATLLAVAKRQGKTPAQVALAWVLRHENAVAIPKAGKEEHVRENAEALGLTLTPADLAELDRAFPAPQGDVELETL